MVIDSIKSSTPAYQGSVPEVSNNIQQEKMSSPELVKKQVVSTEENGEISQNTQQDTEVIKKILNQMNSHSDSTAVFGYHEDTNRIIIKIVDKDTNEVIKEFPSEKLLDMVAKTWELLGLMVDEKR